MFLMTGDAKYIDVLERSLYNNVLSGVSLSGDHFFYPNPLESVGQHKRSEWFGCACCPSNICRFIPSMPNYIYAQKNNQLYINLFVPSTTTFKTEKGNIKLTQESNMPWDGNISVTLQPEKSMKSKLYIRIPGWASNQPVPGDLYSFLNPPSSKPVFKVNGETVNPKTDKGYAIISRTWKPGDLVEIGFPFEIRKIKANENIEDDRGKMALQLGPLVYCAEWADYKDPDILSLVLPENTSLSSTFKPTMLGGINIISGDAEGAKKVKGSDEIATWPRKFTAIPYYAWAHRGQGQMAVWIPTTKEASRAEL